MQKRRISLIVDHPLRDLPGLALVAYRLAQMDFDVFLVPMYAQERECLSLASDFVLLNYLRRNNENFVDRLIDCGIQFGVNDTEGGFYGDLDIYRSILSQRFDLFEAMNCNLIWGKKMFSYLQNNFRAKQRMVLTGLPRFDFYSPQFRSLKLSHLPDLLKNKNVCLINTKVAIANPLFLSKKQEELLYKSKLGLSNEYVETIIKNGLLSIEDNIQLAKEISKQFPETSIVIRPHPHENDETYRKAISPAEFANVSVHREGPVIPWILHSDCVIHRHCTTAIEAAIAGKPALAPQWIRTSANAPDAELVSHRLQSPSELNDAIKAASKNSLAPTPSIQKELERIIDEWLFQVDGLSHRRVADAVAEHLKQNKRPDLEKTKKQIYSIFDSRKDPVGRIYHGLNKISESVPGPLWLIERQRLGKWKNSVKNFTPQNITDWIAPVQQTENQKPVSISWASESDEYIDQYPGVAVKVTKTGA